MTVLDCTERVICISFSRACCFRCDAGVCPQRLWVALPRPLGHVGAVHQLRHGVGPHRPLPEAARHADVHRTGMCGDYNTARCFCVSARKYWPASAIVNSLALPSPVLHRRISCLIPLVCVVCHRGARARTSTRHSARHRRRQRCGCPPCRASSRSCAHLPRSSTSR
jgi:hypothetical protein